jgi:hypothetical protein
MGVGNGSDFPSANEVAWCGEHSKCDGLELARRLEEKSKREAEKKRAIPTPLHKPMPVQVQPPSTLPVIPKTMSELIMESNQGNAAATMELQRRGLMEQTAQESPEEIDTYNQAIHETEVREQLGDLDHGESVQPEQGQPSGVQSDIRIGEGPKAPTTKRRGRPAKAR